ncbi:MAG: Gx transporter family protein [Candidatus Izemoplasmataceae bacterium]|jgi:heptaprenyl diphosphate synthase|uniref:Gx transporter family protein n=1 Tax=Liberiplasma polymorphum TaxID=3374570 RepID=UPI003770EDA4
METRRITFLAVLLATSVVLNIVERVTMQALTQPIAIILGPVIGAGGVRIGLANIVVMLILYNFSTKDAFVLLMLRIIIVGQLAIGLFSLPFWTSLMGGLVGFFLMVIFKHFKGFSIISVSIMGAIGHVFGQIFVAVIFFQLIEIVVYVPFMLMLSIPAGIFTGRVTIKLIDIMEPILTKNQ